ncbi:DciA family protein [Streptomyces sp. IBSNAI002]|uniref:DciA family protein n=1 Tax=Streptomyces sp. IBSNAI002 TaxID=3457500 RepID=UPI003FD0675A
MSSSSAHDPPGPAVPGARPGDGTDLAWVALQTARQAAARSRLEPAARQDRPSRDARPRGSDPREPAPLTDALSTLLAQRAWQLPVTGQRVRDLWVTAAKGLGRHVEATGFDTGTGLLELRPESAAYATQARLSADMLVQRINDLLGTETVLGLRILPPGPPDSPRPPGPATHPGPPAPPAPPADDAEPSPGYQRALAAHRTARATRLETAQQSSRRGTFGPMDGVRQ